MNTEEKNDFISHQDKYKIVMQQIYARSRIPWQKILVPEKKDPRYEEWFSPAVLRAIQQREQDRLFAERAGKILFNMSVDDENERDPYVIEGKRRIRQMLNK